MPLEKQNLAGQQAQPAQPVVQAPQPEGVDVIKNIVSTETSEGEEKILEVAPEVDTSLMEDIEPPKSITLLVLKSLFVVLVIASLGSVLFFTSQLGNTFDFLPDKFAIPNISQDLASITTEIIGLQTDANFYKYLQVKAFLDEFSYYGDSYLQNYEIANSQTAQSSQKRTAEAEMANLQGSLRTAFMNIKDKLAINFSAPLVGDAYQSDADLNSLFRERLMQNLKDEANDLAQSTEPEAQRDFRNYTHTLNLIGNTVLQNLVVQTDFDALTDTQLYALIKDVNAVIVNDLSIIQEIKDQRIKWSDIINEIERKTVAVDTYHSQDFYEQMGGIRYTSYDFDTTGRTISITGETRRVVDTLNFSMIADLIDTLNESSLFANAEMRSFSKSGSLETGYVASLRLSLDLLEHVAEADVIASTNQ